jgi:glycosyltransferase involved in cell wall biosynthesis
MIAQDYEKRASILVPCFNAEKFIAQCIESALAQTLADKEVIVVDDGSTDRSLEIIRSFGDRIRWESGPNRGGNAARNRLLDLAKGEWLQYLDADDYLLPEKLQRQLDFAARHPQAAIICSPVQAEKIENGRLITVTTRFPASRDPWVLLALWHLPQTGGTLWKRSALLAVGGWRLGQPCCQEHELYCRLLQAGTRFEFLDEALELHRDWDHGGRLTQRMIDEVERQRLIILDRMEQFLRERGELSAPRHQAINDMRHEIARKTWNKDQPAALVIVRRIYESDPSFLPGDRAVSPLAYRLIYRAIGFSGAQRIAGYRRKLASLLEAQPA